MREIKFKLLKNNKLVGYEIHKDFNGNIGIFHQYLPKKEGHTALEVEITEFPDDAIVHDKKIQFTGLKDKNGKEIYEGDIIYMAFIENFGYWNIPKDCQGQEMSRFEVNGVVCYDDCGFVVNDKKEGNISLTKTADEIKIIGNIYENPKLLREVKP